MVIAALQSEYEWVHWQVLQWKQTPLLRLLTDANIPRGLWYASFEYRST